MPSLDPIARHFERLCELSEQDQKREIDSLGLAEADRVMLMKLLAADRREGDPIHAVIVDGVAGINAPDSIHFGPWRLVRELGSGGMGTVFLAERSDGHFEQKAAIKLLRGFPTSEGMRRLRQERRILAGLDHPNIARLLDGGESETGQPWLAMEYVDGLPLLEYARRHAPSLRDRLGLLSSMLDAIGHAHSHLIVHRDLKPANVLVTRAGEVKLLDFGIARLLDSADELAASTSTRIYSRGYASPEQRDGAAITTASDIFSIGVILQELLTGRRENSAAEAPLVPALPLDADLAGIIAKACAQRPQDRYANAGEFGADLQRFLEGRPVSATQLTRGYRLRKFVSRHRVGVGLAALAVLLVAVFVWRLERERDRAVNAELSAQAALEASDRDAARARASLQFLTDAISAASPEVAMKRQVGVRDLLDAARAKLETSDTNDPAFGQSMKRLLAHLYSQLGEARIGMDLMREGLVGVEPANGQEALRLADDYEEYAKLLGVMDSIPMAMDAAQKANAWRERFAPDNPTLRVESLQSMAMVHHRGGDDGEAIRLLREAWAVPAGKSSDEALGRIESAQLLASLLAVRGECEESLQYSEKAMALASALAPDSPDRLAPMRSRATALNSCGRSAEAEPLLREAIALQDRAVAAGGSRMMNLTNDLALTLNDLGQYQEAALLLQRSDTIALDAGMGEAEHAMSLANLAGVLENAGDYEGSLTALRQAIDLLDKVEMDADHQSRRRITRSLARTLGLAGQDDKAWPLMQELRERCLRIEGQDSGEYAMLTWQLALLAERMGNRNLGIGLVDEAERLWSALAPPSHPLFAHVLRLRARWAVRAGDIAAAEQNLREASRILSDETASPVDLAIVRSELAQVLWRRQGKAAARDLMLAALPVLRGALLATEVNRVRAEALAAQLGMGH
jgi:tetratricopeptide (TPR) repeat protein/predicted Ser/Thr protein kinase